MLCTRLRSHSMHNVSPGNRVELCMNFTFLTHFPRVYSSFDPVAMLSDSASNIVIEAQHLGVKVTSEKTFLTFDKENIADDPADACAFNFSRRRFTTTEMVMNKELMEQLRGLDASPLTFLRQFSGEADVSDSMVNVSTAEGDDPVAECGIRRNSACSQLTADFEEKATPDNGEYQSLLAPTPMAAPLVMSPVPVYDTSHFTTVMIRNVPNRYSQDELIAMVKRLGFSFNFFYCPIDRQSRANCGYFFINLLQPQMAVDFINALHGLQLPAFRSVKVCIACWARIQGYSANVDQYKNSPLAELPREFRPRVFSADMTEVSLVDQSVPDCPPRRSQADLKSRKLFVGGLSPTTTTDTIRAHLSQFGEIEDVSVILDSASRTSRGFGFVTFADQASLKLCIDTPEAHFIDGRSVGIRPYSKV